MDTSLTPASFLPQIEETIQNTETNYNTPWQTGSTKGEVSYSLKIALLGRK